jgi:MYXO-CTERM domain-containing protein
MRPLRQTLPRILPWTLLGLLASGSTAQAFCRSTTSKRQPESCAAACVTEGFPLAWTEPDLHYVLNERGFPGLADDQVRAIFEQAFQTWEDVTCDGEAIGLSVQAEPTTTSLERRADQDQYATNVIGHLSGEAWTEAGLSPLAFALTGVRFNVHSGALLGADIWFNGGMGTFAVCPEEGCEEPNETVDLLNVATHEVGHFLGLAHSNIEGSTMECSAEATDVDKRTLEADDRAGLCAIYPPGTAFEQDYVEGAWTEPSADTAGSCSVRQNPARPPALALPWLALCVLVVVRRRQTQSARVSAR